MLTLPLPKWRESWDKDIVNITFGSYSFPIVLIPKYGVAFLSSLNATPYHDSILFGKLGEEAIIIILLPWAPSHPCPTCMARKSYIAFVSPDDSAPVIPRLVLIGYTKC